MAKDILLYSVSYAICMWTTVGCLVTFIDSNYYINKIYKYQEIEDGSV